MATQTFKGFRLIIVDNIPATFDKDKIYFVRTNSGGTNIGEDTNYKEEGYLYFNGKKYGNVTPLEDRLHDFIGAIPAGASATTVIGYINEAVEKMAISAHGDTNYITAGTTGHTVGVSAITADLGTAMTWNGETKTLTVGTASSATGLAKVADVDAKRIADETAIKNAFDSLKAGIDGLDATVTGGTNLIHVEVVQVDGKLSSVTVTDQAKLTAAVASAETAVQGVSGDSYVTATKTGTGVTLATTTHAINTAEADTDGLATAFAVKNAISGAQVTDVKYVTGGTAQNPTYTVQLYNGNIPVGKGFDATDFVKDGMLTSAELAVNPEGQEPGTYIKLTWNTDAGKQPMYINVSSLIDTYTVSGDSANYLAIDDHKVGALTGSVASNTAGIADAQDVKSYVDGQITALTDNLNTALTATNNHVTVGFNQTTGLVNSLAVTVVTAATANATSTDNDGLAKAKDVKDYVDGQITTTVSGLTANVSGDGTYVHITVSEKDGKLTAATVVDSALTETVNKAASAVQSVNGETGTSITLDATDIKMGEGLTGNASAATASSAVSEVLQDIYDRLAASSAELSIASADSSITVTTGATGTDIIVNREATGSTTIEAGHIAIEKNNQGGLYGQMYYDGDDAE